MTTRKKRRVSAKDRAAVRAHLGSDLAWGRPTEPTAQFVWELLQDGLAIPRDDLMPKRGKGKRSAGPEYEKDALTAKQSLVVVRRGATWSGTS